MNTKELIDYTIDELRAYNANQDHCLEFDRQFRNAHNHAVAKHPMTGMTYEDEWTEGMQKELDRIQAINDNAEKENCFFWQLLLAEEVQESVKELAQGDYSAAQSELVQVAQVAFRAWLWCEQMKAQKEGGEE